MICGEIILIHGELNIHPILYVSTFVYRLIPVMEYMILVYFVTVIVVIIGATFCNKYIFVKVNRGIKILLCGHDIKNTHV